jgi:hypothetical protein
MDLRPGGEDHVQGRVTLGRMDDHPPVEPGPRGQRSRDRLHPLVAITQRAGVGLVEDHATHRLEGATEVVPRVVDGPVGRQPEQDGTHHRGGVAHQVPGLEGVRAGVQTQPTEVDQVLVQVFRPRLDLEQGALVVQAPVELHDLAHAGAVAAELPLLSGEDLVHVVGPGVPVVERVLPGARERVPVLVHAPADLADERVIVSIEPARLPTGLGEVVIGHEAEFHLVLVLGLDLRVLLVEVGLDRHAVEPDVPEEGPLGQGDEVEGRVPRPDEPEYGRQQGQLPTDLLPALGPEHEALHYRVVVVGAHEILVLADAPETRPLDEDVHVLLAELEPVRPGPVQARFPGRVEVKPVGVHLVDGDEPLLLEEPKLLAQGTQLAGRFLTANDEEDDPVDPLDGHRSGHREDQADLEAGHRQALLRGKGPDDAGQAHGQDGREHLVDVAHALYLHVLELAARCCSCRPLLGLKAGSVLEGGQPSVQ